MQRIKGFNEKVKNALMSKGEKQKKPKAGPKVVAATPTQAPASKPLPKGFKVVERYPLYEPFAHAAIARNPSSGEYKYILDELRLDILERNVYDRILDILLAEIASPEAEIEDPRQFFVNEAEKIVGKYRISLGWLPDVSWSKW